MKKVRRVEGKPFYCEKQLRNPKLYQVFLRVALKYADEICMSYNGGYKDFGESEWSFLMDSVMDHEYTNETPVTIHSGSATLLLYLKINHTTMEWLKAKKNIFDYLDDEGNWSYFEDFSLVKDGTLVFCSCSHEGFCYMNQELYELMPKDIKDNKTSRR